MLHGEFEEFAQKYYRVFDSEGHVKACGRKACIDLIELCERIHRAPAGAYGNVETGIMNVPAIKTVAFDILQYENEIS